LLLLGVLVIGCSGIQAQENTFSVHVQLSVRHSPKADNQSDNSGVVVWLTPLSPSAARPVVPAQGLRLVQKNKRFEPHLLVIPVGSTVEFPNQDPFFHNVFSLFKGKRFDLGFYEAGSSRSVRFDRPGASFIFCNIHPEMSAVVLAVQTNDYAISNAAGEAQIAHVAPGKYRMDFWFQNSSPELLAALSREIDVTANTQIQNVIVPEVTVSMTHKNKFGQNYDTKPTY
jgi:plastocyanin